MKRVFIFFLIFISISFSFADALSKSDRVKILHMRQDVKRDLLEHNRHVLDEKKAKLSDINNKEQELSSQLKHTESELWKVESDIRSLQERKRALENEIELVSTDILALKDKIQREQKMLRKRMREMYKNDTSSYLSVLLNADSFFDFLTTLDFLKKVVNNDIAMISELKQNRLKLEHEEAHLKQMRVSMVEEEKAFRERQTLCSSLHAKRKGILNQVESQRLTVAQDVYETEMVSRELELELESLIREEQALNRPKFSAARISSSGSYIWPVRGYITSPFGYRMHPIRGRYIFHSGIDIATSYGTPIHAAASGIVIMSGWYGGYGNAVIIDHGGGYSTLYGHCSALFVSKGQRVAQGSSIASVGSTGMSTGPHVHFEVRYNGSPIEPRSKL